MMNQINPQANQENRREEMDKFKPETGNTAINELNKQEIDKAKTELKILSISIKSMNKAGNGEKKASISVRIPKRISISNNNTLNAMMRDSQE